jgi:hypothetical protein
MDDDLDERVEKVNKELAALEIEVDLWDHEQKTRFRAIVSELKGDNSTLAAAVGRVGTAADEELHAIGTKTRQAIERLEGEVKAAWADFEAERADDLTRYQAAARNELEAWQRLVDRMRVQSHLAGMDAKDAVAEMEHAFDAARPELERAKDAAEDALDTLKRHVRELVAHLRQAARDASRIMA